MPDTILVPFDGSPLSERALEYAVTNFPASTITTIYVIDPIDSVLDVEAGGLPVAESWFDDARERADAILAAATEAAAAQGVELETVTRVGRPAHEVLECVDERSVDQVIMGSHGRTGVERAILGSVAETVMRRARVPVTIVR